VRLDKYIHSFQLETDVCFSKRRRHTRYIYIAPVLTPDRFQHSNMAEGHSLIPWMLVLMCCLARMAEVEGASEDRLDSVSRDILGLRSDVLKLQRKL
jgi:hypothetical protein